MSAETVNAEVVGTDSNELAPIHTNTTAVAPINTSDDDFVGVGQGSNYAFFFSSKSKKAVDIITACGRCAAGDVITFINNKFERWEPGAFEFFFVSPAKAQYWAQLNSENKVMVASLTEQRAWPWREHVDTLLLFAHPTDGVLYPIRMTFAGPKAGATKDIVKAIKAGTETPTVFQASIKQNWARVFVGGLDLETKEPIAERKAAGATAYQVCNANTVATTEEHLGILRECWKTKEFRSAWDKCVKDMAGRLAYVKGKVPPATK